MAGTFLHIYIYTFTSIYFSYVYFLLQTTFLLNSINILASPEITVEYMHIYLELGQNVALESYWLKVSLSVSPLSCWTVTKYGIKQHHIRTRRDWLHWTVSDFQLKTI